MLYGNSLNVSAILLLHRLKKISYSNVLYCKKTVTFDNMQMLKLIFVTSSTPLSKNK